MEPEDVKEKVLDYIRANQETEISDGRILDYIQSEKEKAQGNTSHYLPKLDACEKRAIAEYLFQLVVSGVLAPGSLEKCDLTWKGDFSLTSFGRRAIEASSQIPLDLEGYVCRLQQNAPGIDSIALDYAREAFAAYQRQLLLSPTVMVGAASERIFEVIRDALVTYLPADESRAFSKKLEQKRHLGDQWKCFKEKFDQQVRNDLPEGLRKDVDVYIDEFFHLARVNRNDAGHPTGETIDRDTVLLTLKIFLKYIKRIYQIIDWLNKNPRK